MEKGFSHLYNQAWCILAAGGLIAGALTASDALAARQTTLTHEQVPGELLVKLRRDPVNKRIQYQALTQLERSLGAQAVVKVNPLLTDAELHKIKIAKPQDVAKAVELLRQDPSVQFAEPNYIMRAFDDGAPNDPDFNKLWGMRNVGQADSSGQQGTPGSDIGVLPLWQKGITGSKNILVAVIDTGIDWTHPDLAANLYTNPGESGEVAGNGKDNDGNGFVNDIHGWNFVANNNNSNDDHDHGTHCAGTIGGVGNNGVGVAGVNWNVSLMPVKFLSADGSGTLEAAVNSINYATMMKVNVMSNSWGGGPETQSLKDAITKARDAGILFVAAAGNSSSNNDGTPTYPASYAVENVLSVAAIDNRDGLASFSNFGAKTVHVAAPGVKVYSTTKGGNYNTFSGTSMATPHVSGVAALIWSAFPELGFAGIKDRLIKTSQPVQNLRSKVIAKGRVNANNAYYNIVPPSQEPDESLWKTVQKTVESPHPYKDNANLTFDVSYPGAKYIRVFFEKIDTEAKYDKVTVEDSKSRVVEEYTGFVQNQMSDYVMSDKVVIRLRSDSSQTGWGFKISKIQVITDR